MAERLEGGENRGAISEAALRQASPPVSPIMAYLGSPNLTPLPQSCPPLQDIFLNKPECLHRRMQ